jgi:hypothetical protein
MSKDHTIPLALISSVTAIVGAIVAAPHFWTKSTPAPAPAPVAASAPASAREESKPQPAAVAAAIPAAESARDVSPAADTGGRAAPSEAVGRTARNGAVTADLVACREDAGEVMCELRMVTEDPVGTKVAFGYASRAIGKSGRVFKPTALELGARNLRPLTRKFIGTTLPNGVPMQMRVWFPIELAQGGPVELLELKGSYSGFAFKNVSIDRAQ